MSWLSNINNALSAKKEQYQFIVVVQADAVYTSRNSDNEQVPQSFAITNGNWEGALSQALTLAHKKESICVVLGATQYQTFQIEKPNIPQNEWSTALPFLLKDLITDPVTDVVADARVMPDGQKVLAYVIHKRIVQSILKQCEKYSLGLAKILPEDEVWGQAYTAQENYFLLRHSEQSSYHLSAYVAGCPVFSRTLRGISMPVTASDSESGVIDNLALDIQRSADYLSSNLSGALFRNLVINCDKDNASQLNEQLQAIVSLTVVSIDEPPLPCVNVIINTVLATTPSSINLYPEHLRPHKEVISLNKVVAVWLITAAVFGVLSYLEHTKSVQSQQQLVSLKQQSNLLGKEKSSLQQSLNNHTPTQAKLDAAKRIEQDIAAKRSSLDAVNQFDDSQKVGYSAIMNALAQQARNDISLQHIQITSDKLNLVGVASTPQSVPSWVNQFKKELVLVGRSFQSLNLDRSQRGVVRFELKAKSGDKQ
ncbi:PilN domain-containing protein [Vibrio gallicus]|uniref:PilN domain-containing protein n=1 Tax=Vibrio gallicus TaxID=190897 RepID=UPI0021C308A9|nr:PilN domain-containing protein [Vibrio gallicus]